MTPHSLNLTSKPNLTTNGKVARSTVATFRHCNQCQSGNQSSILFNYLFVGLKVLRLRIGVRTVPDHFDELRIHVGEEVDTSKEIRRRLSWLAAEEIPNHLEKEDEAKRQLTVRDYLKLKRFLAGSDAIDDPKLRMSDLQIISSRRCANYFVDPIKLPRWARDIMPTPPNAVERGWLNKSALFVEFDPVFPIGMSVTEEQAKNAFVSAMESWNRANVGIRFELGFGSGDIVVRWIGPSFDPERFLSATTFAHADFPPPDNNQFGPPPLPVCFSAIEKWSVNGDDTALDLESVALHELGHCLGLFHRDFTSIMYDRLFPGQIRRDVDVATISSAKSLYDT